MQVHLTSGRRGFRHRSGTAAVELAVVLPLIIALILGLLTVGRMLQVSEIISNAAREGARKASTGVNTYSDVQSTITSYLTNAGITNQAGLNVTVYDVTQGNLGPQFDPSTAVYLDQLQVTVTLPYYNVQLAPFPGVPNTLLAGQAVWYSNQDQAYPSTIVPPPGN